MEITERKNSMSSSARMDDEDEEEVEDCEGPEPDEEEDDDDDREGTPVQKIIVDDDDVRMSMEEQVHTCIYRDGQNSVLECVNSTPQPGRGITQHRTNIFGQLWPNST